MNALLTGSSIHARPENLSGANLTILLFSILIGAAHIVNLHEVLTSSKNLYMVMDLVTGGELFDAVAAEGRLSEVRTRLYFQQLVDGVHYCHTRRVYHRDLKPENLLLSGDKQTLKITDFGLSSIKAQNASSELLHTIMGSPHYIAPEIITSAAQGYDGGKVDVWAAGIILFGMLAGHLPFDEVNTRALYRAIVQNPISYPAHFSYDVIKLLRAMLQKDPDKRPTMEHVKTFTWFKVDYEPAATPEEKKSSDVSSKKKAKSKLKKHGERLTRHRKKDKDKASESDTKETEEFIPRSPHSNLSEAELDIKFASRSSLVEEVCTNFADIRPKSSGAGPSEELSRQSENMGPTHSFTKPPLRGIASRSSTAKSSSSRSSSEKAQTMTGSSSVECDSSATRVSFTSNRSVQLLDMDRSAPSSMRSSDCTGSSKSKSRELRGSKEFDVPSRVQSHGIDGGTGDMMPRDRGYGQTACRQKQDYCDVDNGGDENADANACITGKKHKEKSESGRKAQEEIDLSLPAEHTYDMESAPKTAFISPLSTSAKSRTSFTAIPQKNGAKGSKGSQPGFENLFSNLDSPLSPYDVLAPKALGKDDREFAVTAVKGFDPETPSASLVNSDIFKPAAFRFASLAPTRSPRKAALSPNVLCPEIESDMVEGTNEWCIDCGEVFADVETEDQESAEKDATEDAKLSPSLNALKHNQSSGLSLDVCKRIFAPLDSDMALKFSPSMEAEASNARALRKWPTPQTRKK